MTSQPAVSRSVATPLRVVQGKRFARPKAWGWIVVAAASVALFFGLIVATTALDSSAFELESIQNEIVAEQMKFDRLRLEVARLRSPSRIQPLAEELGMVYPDPVFTREVTARGVVAAASNDDRWADMKSVLSASP